MTTLNPDHVNGTAVICESCGTAIEKPNNTSAEQTAEEHNKRRHDDEDVATAVTSEVDVDTSDLPREKKKRFVRQIVDLLD